MLLEYAGPRVKISQRGITTQDYHPDKYIYFKTVFQLFKQLEKIHLDTSTFVLEDHTAHVHNADILKWINDSHPEVMDHIQKFTLEYNKKLAFEYQRVKENRSISQEERDTWLTNLTLMEKYRLQRAKNKIFYTYMLDSIVEMILSKGIEEFVFLYTINNFHIVQALSNHISSVKKSINPFIFIKRNDFNTFIYLVLQKYS